LYFSTISLSPAAALNSRTVSSTRCAKPRSGTGTDSPCETYSFSFTGAGRPARIFFVPGDSV
jgi:hypothetical protein